MKPFITFIRKNGYGERTFHLKNYGYFKLPAHLVLNDNHLKDTLTKCSRVYTNPDEFVGAFESLLYIHWSVEELRTCRGEMPGPLPMTDARDRLSVAYSTIKICKNKGNRASIRRSIKSTESLTSFAERTHALTSEIVRIWRDRFISTPMELLKFSETLEPEVEFEDLYGHLRKETALGCNHQFKHVGETKYQRNIIKIGTYGYFIVPKHMTITPYHNNRIVIITRTTDNSSRQHIHEVTNHSAICSALRAALQFILDQRGTLEYHCSQDTFSSINRNGPSFSYQKPIAIRERDGGESYVLSHSRRELLIRQAADKRWIADNLETKSLEGLTILHKEFPKDPM